MIHEFKVLMENIGSMEELLLAKLGSPNQNPIEEAMKSKGKQVLDSIHDLLEIEMKHDPFLAMALAPSSSSFFLKKSFF
jgi:hypothetical protein